MKICMYEFEKSDRAKIITLDSVTRGAERY